MAAPSLKTLLVTFCLATTFGVAQNVHAPSDPAKGFNPRANPRKTVAVNATAADPARVNQANGVVLLRPHGNVNGGVDYGYNNAGVVLGAKVFSTNFAHAVELYYYLPSNSDKLYREGDYRGSTGRLGSNAGDDVGEYYCPEGYAGVGLEGSAGLFHPGAMPGCPRICTRAGKTGDETCRRSACGH